MLADRERLAREAAARVDDAREHGRQLSLLVAEASPADPAEIAPRGPGRPKGATGKRTSKLRQMLAARGFRMPEDVVAEVAGLGQRDVSAVELAMLRAEQVAAWLEDRTGGVPLKRDQLLGLFVSIWKEQNGAAAALLPYGLEKVTPDQVQAPAVTLVMPVAAVQAPAPGDRARVIDADLAPPPLPGEIERIQRLADEAPARPTRGSRTE